MLSILTESFRHGLDFLYAITGSYGLAIILLTVIIRVVLLPFTFSQTKSMRRMQELTPQLQKLQQKYKNDPQRLNREVMELWRKHKINPMAGCLPLLLQLPILWALFRVLYSYNYSAAASFLWLPDLAKADPYYVLPVLAGITTWWQSKVSMIPGGGAEQTQKTMMYIMPLFIVWIALQYASGLSLYWVMSNIFGVAQQYVTNWTIRTRPAAKGESK